MKKFNFFAVFITGLFMFVGFAANAQYLSSSAAMTRVEKELELLKNNPPAADDANAPELVSQVRNLHDLKIVVGQSMLKPLGNGKSVEEAIRLSVAPFVSGGNTGASLPARNSIVAEVETYYRNLLKI